MAIASVAFGPDGPPVGFATTLEPEHFEDLNLVQVVDEIIGPHHRPQLAPYFRYALRDPDIVRFRPDVFRDLESDEVRSVVAAFAASMRSTRRRQELVGTLYYPRQTHRWFLDTVLAFTDAAAVFAADLDEVTLAAAGLQALRDEFARYAKSPEFEALHTDALRLRSHVDAVRLASLGATVVAVADTDNRRVRRAISPAGGSLDLRPRGPSAWPRPAKRTYR